MLDKIIFVLNTLITYYGNHTPIPNNIFSFLIIFSYQELQQL